MQTIFLCFCLSNIPLVLINFSVEFQIGCLLLSHKYCNRPDTVRLKLQRISEKKLLEWIAARLCETVEIAAVVKRML